MDLSVLNGISHDIENSAITVDRMSKGASPLMLKALDYCETNSVDLFSTDQLSVLKSALIAISEESEKLLKLSKSLRNEVK